MSTNADMKEVEEPTGDTALEEWEDKMIERIMERMEPPAAPGESSGSGGGVGE